MTSPSRRPGLRRIAVLLASTLALAATATTTLAPAVAQAAPTPRVSFTQAQQTFMCTICHEPLNEARSPEAYQENGQLRQYIAHGDTLAQIKHEMVSEYGIGVLADPPARGFSLLVFIVPGVVIVLGLLVLAYTIPHWRRRAGTERGDDPPPTHRTLSDEDAQRLDADLARHA